MGGSDEVAAEVDETVADGELAADGETGAKVDEPLVGSVAPLGRAVGNVVPEHAAKRPMISRTANLLTTAFTGLQR